MTTKELEKLMQEVNKKNPNNNIWFTSIVLTNTYLTKFFNGTETNLLKKAYSKYLFAYILEFLNDSKNLKDGNFTPHILESFIDDIRKVTRPMRAKILHEWIGFVLDKKQSDNPLTQSLLTFYPSIKEMKEVKKQLGLNYAIN